MPADFKGLAGGYRQFLLNYQIDFESIRDLSNKFIFWACPFNVILGAIDATETGLKPLYADPSDYTQFARVFDAKGAVLATWTDSYSLTQNTGQTPKENYAIKTFKIGRTYKGVMVQEGTDDQFIPSAGNTGYTSQQVNKSITMRFYNIKENEKMFTDLTSGVLNLNFYILPNFNTVRQEKERKQNWSIQKKHNPFYDECRTFFYSDQENTTIFYSNDGEFGYIEMTFYSIDSRIARSGISINTYIQLGGAGEPFAFPLLNNANDIVLDTARATSVPVTHAQVQFLGFSGVNAISFAGRPVYEIDLIKGAQYRLYPTCKIWFRQFQKPINNKISLKSYPTDTYYWLRNFNLNLVKSYSYTKTFNALYNPYQPKNVQGYINTDYDGTTKTNTDNVYYDSSFLASSSIWTYNKSSINLWDVAGNPYFIYADKNGDYFTTLTNNPTTVPYNFDFSKVPDGASDVSNGLALFFAFNDMLENTQIQLPLEYTDLTMVDAVNFPVVGALFRALSFGFVGEGWSYSNIRRPKYPYFNCLISANIYEAYTNTFISALNFEAKDITPKPTFEKGLLPFEAFYKGFTDGVGIFTGANSITQSFCGNLTHMVSIDSVSNDGTKLGLKKLASSEIQQDISKNLSTGKVWTRPEVNEKFTLLSPQDDNDNPNYIPAGAGLCMGYIIDFFRILNFSKADYQIKFFSVHGWNPALPDVVSDENCVWMGTFKSQAETTENTRMFFNYGLLSDPKFSFKSRFHYPQDLQPVPPKGNQIITEQYEVKLTTFSNLVNFDVKGEISSDWLIEPTKTLGSPILIQKINKKTGYNLQKINIKNVSLSLKSFSSQTSKNYTTSLTPFSNPATLPDFNISNIKLKYKSSLNLNIDDWFNYVLVSKEIIIPNLRDLYLYHVLYWNRYLPADAQDVWNSIQTLAKKEPLLLNCYFQIKEFSNYYELQFVFNSFGYQFDPLEIDPIGLYASSISRLSTTTEKQLIAWDPMTDLSFNLQGTLNDQKPMDITAIFIKT